MEEVWKDISLPSLNDHPPDSIISPGASNLNFPGTILLDFLAGPINNKETTIPRTSDVSNDVSFAQGTTLFDSRLLTPGTILSLNSGSDLRYVDSGNRLRSNPTLNAPTGVASAQSFGCSAVSPPFGPKRGPESNENSHDQRHKRMKNRESATRSRARKQAHTTELELEVAHLQEENAKLRRQQEKLLSSTDQLPKKTSLTRTLTAPF